MGLSLVRIGLNIVRQRLGGKACHGRRKVECSAVVVLAISEKIKVAGTILWTDREREGDACLREWFLTPFPAPVRE